MTSSAVVTSPQDLRRSNAATVLRTVWDGAPFTASDVIATTGLTRSTVLGMCDELVQRGWITELEDARSAGTYQKGRPARRYAFAAEAGYVVGVDAGWHRIAATVADLGGTPRGAAEASLGEADTDPALRRETVLAVLDRALTDAGVAREEVLAIVAGVPAPTDAAGTSPRGHEFWERMNPALADALSEQAPIVEVENDANLAAVAEGAVGGGTDLQSFGVLLSGERFGSGLIVDGKLLRGRSGGAGELRLLDLVTGVGGPEGLGYAAREMAHEAMANKTVPPGSALLRAGTAGPDAEHVFAAALNGDPLATDIVAQLADRLARVCAVIATMLDLERIIVAGAIAPAAEPVVAQATELLREYTHPPHPTITASTLGADVVRTGALQRAVALVRADPLGLPARQTRQRRA
ncbi:ROK family protein [Ruania alkalisoli]|uniref:ROK family protein n=1 Tax=Ruania alkalisoli TaxID=2779775 RepID=A0A7M1SUP6_9MICO|nr:ROK family transcriptional regulator [Ruania alkalisoli]QOR71309.1 ROK family protein [Ruania alkalisoli]